MMKFVSSFLPILLLCCILNVADCSNQFNQTKRAALVCTTIADCGTNSGTALTNGKLMYSSGSAIVENANLVSTGSFLDINGATMSITPVAPTTLNIKGTASSQVDGPHINTYVSGDNYPVMSLYSYAHDDVSLLFDTYPDSTGAIKSSFNANNYRIRKTGGSFNIERSGLIAPGNAITWNPSIKIYPTGLIDITSLSTNIYGGDLAVAAGSLTVSDAITTGVGINLPNAYGSGTILNFHEHYSTTVSTSKYLGAGTVSAVSVYLTAERTGRTVTVTVAPVTGVTIGAGGASILIGRLPTQFKPLNAVSQVIVIAQDGVYNGGQLIVNSLGDVAVMGALTPTSSFTAGINRGTASAVSVSYETL